MKIEVEIGKKYFIGIVAVMLIIAGAFFVVSYNSNPPVPATFGHSANEIEGLDLGAPNLCICIETYYLTFQGQQGSGGIKCAPLGSWSDWSAVYAWTWKSRVALVEANADGSCTPPSI